MRKDKIINKLYLFACDRIVKKAQDSNKTATMKKNWIDHLKSRKTRKNH